MNKALRGRGGALRARAGSTRTAGLAVAAVFSVAFAGLIAFYALRGPRTSNAGLSGQEAPAPPDIKDISKTAGTGTGFEVAGGKEQRVTFTDRNDPTRVAGELGWDRLEPLEGKRYRLEQPRSFNYMKDGRIVYVRADQGQFVIPRQDQEPQSGTLSGNVEIKLFPPVPAGLKLDPGQGVPLLTARMESVEFDTTTGEMRTASRVVGEGEFGEFAFTGLHVVTNQSERRVELLEIDRGEKIVLKPARLRSGGGGGASAIAENKPKSEAGQPVATIPAVDPATPGAPSTTPPALLDEVFYAAAFSEDVRVVQGDKEISSDRLRSWARLVDGKLAPGATGDLEKLADKPAEPAMDKPGENPEAPAADDAIAANGASPGISPASDPANDPANQGEVDPSATPRSVEGLASMRSDEDVTITWTGPLVLKTEKERPGELAADEVSMRFESDLPGGTRFSATGQKAGGSATDVEYFATTRRVALIGDDTTPAVVRSEGAGRLEAKGVSIGIATGVVDIASGGVLVQDKASEGDEPAPDAVARRVAWSESAQFLFDTQDGQMTGALREAFLHGKVDARDGRGALSTGDLHATFIPSPRTDGQAVLRRIEARDGVNADDGRGGTLAAGELDLSFVPIRKGEAGIGESDPRECEARGGVRVERDGVTLDADRLRAGLTSGGDQGAKKNEIEVTDVKADGMVRFTRSDGVTAYADQLRADAVREIVELMGERVSLSKGASTVSGTAMVLRGAERSLEVFGAGVFEHKPTAPNAPNAEGAVASSADTGNPGGDLGHVLATWNGGMSFSDVSGVLDAAGDVRATYTPGPLEQDKLAGERLHLELTPGESSSDGVASLDLGSKPSEPVESKKPDERALLLASVTGSDLERIDGTRARVESRTYRLNEESSEGRELEGLVYLEGSTIIGDNAQGTLHVPGAGMLLSFDKRNTPPSVEVVGEEPVTARGTARVRWTGDLSYERVAGRATVRGGVKLDHAPIESRDKAELESERLVVRFRDAESMDAGGMRLVRGQFLGATASGAVWARSMGKELTSDQLEYDAAGRTIEAIASEGNLAQMFDPKNPTPMTARRLLWDLARDRVEIKDAGTISVPR